MEIQWQCNKCCCQPWEDVLDVQCVCAESAEAPKAQDPVWMTANQVGLFGIKLRSLDNLDGKEVGKMSP